MTEYDVWYEVQWLNDNTNTWETMLYFDTREAAEKRCNKVEQESDYMFRVKRRTGRAQA